MNPSRATPPAWQAATVPSVRLLRSPRRWWPENASVAMRIGRTDFAEGSNHGCFSSPESTTRVKARPRLLRAGRDSLRGSFATGKSAARTGTNRAGVAQSPARLTVPPRGSKLPVTSRLHRILRRQPKPPGRRQVSTKTRDESAETQAGTDHGPPRYNTRRPDFCGLSMNTALSVPDRIPSKPR